VNLLGPFHLPQTAFSAMVTDAQVGILQTQRGVEDVVKGDKLKGLSNVMQGLVKASAGVPVGLVGKGAYNIYQGRKIVKASEQIVEHGWDNFAGSDWYKQAVKNMHKSGIHMHDDPRMTAAQHLRDAISDLRSDPTLIGKMKAAERVLWNNALNAIGLPMRKIILNGAMYAKVYAANQLANEMLANLPPDATDADRTRILSKIATQVDELFGQVVWDRTGVRRVMRDALQTGIRSPGWTFGSLFYAARAAAETAGSPARLAGKTKFGRKALGSNPVTRPLLGSQTRAKGADSGSGGPEEYFDLGGEHVITPRMAGMLAFLIGSAMVGAIYQGIKTGKRPGEGLDLGTWGVIKDLYYPRNGGIRPDGSEDRSGPIAYAVEWYNWLTHPFLTASNKTSPPIDFLVGRVRGTDYFGNDNPPLLEDALKHTEPFFYQSAKERLQSHGGTASAIESFLGIRPASAEIVRSKAMQMAHDIQKRQGHKILTPEEVEQAKAKHQVVDEAMERGGVDELRKELDSRVDSGEMNRKSADAMLQRAESQPLVNAIRPIKFTEALPVYEAAVGAEKTDELKAAMENKLKNNIASAPYDQVNAILQAAKDAGLDGDAARKKYIEDQVRKAAVNTPTRKMGESAGDFKQKLHDHFEEVKRANEALHAVGATSAGFKVPVGISEDERKQLGRRLGQRKPLSN